MLVTPPPHIQQWQTNIQNKAIQNKLSGKNLHNDYSMFTSKSSDS